MDMSLDGRSFFTHILYQEIISKARPQQQHRRRNDREPRFRTAPSTRQSTAYDDSNTWVHDKHDDIVKSNRGTNSYEPRGSKEIGRYAPSRPEQSRTVLLLEASQEDIEDLFGAIGRTLKVTLYYDHSGRSDAKVEFEKVESAADAIKEYDAREFDGQLMKVAYVVEDNSKRIAARLGPYVKQIEERLGNAPRSYERRDTRAPRDKAPRPTTARGGKTGDRREKKAMTAEELDAQMDDFMSAGAKDVEMEQAEVVREIVNYDL